MQILRKIMDIRHQERIKIIQELYAQTFKSQSVSDKTAAVIDKQTEINTLIKKYAAKFPVDKIAKLDLAILQLSIYELIFEKKEPPKVIINEAVELAKEFGSDKSYSFINAILGKVYGR